MTIVNFTPISALLGGLLIGLAAALFLVFNGRIAGISGLLGGILTNEEGSKERIAFVLGVVVSPLLWVLFVGDLPEIEVTNNVWLLVAGGFLVGFGSRAGSGCTSGHGICGLARLSKRSLVATLSFMATGFLTVFLMRHVF